ncbi:MAG: ABC transporter substrate binding protein, partial [Chloroflexota bacterium]
ELLKETVPTLAHLAAIADPSVQSSTLPAAVSNRAQVELASQALGLPYTWYDVRNLDQLPSVLSTAVADGADGLVVISGGVILGGTDPRIGSAVLRSRLPGVGDNRLFAVNGGLLAHGVETLALARRSAFYVDRILRGAKPADLPIELPTRFNIVINLRSALELGITVPQSVLARATEVIQ